MASGDGLGLFFNTNRLPCGPPAPPIPPPPPPGLASSIITGTEDQRAGVSYTSPAHVTGCSVGDILVAFMNMFETTGVTMVGNVPAGWSVVREDQNAGSGSLHGPMFSGIATKVADASDVAAGTYSFANPSSNFLNVSIACVHQSQGIDSISYTHIDNSISGTITAAGTVCAQSNEIVLVAGLWGTGSGSAIDSDNGLTAAMPNAQADMIYFQTGPTAGATSAPQGLTCHQTSDAFSAYQVSMKRG